MSKSQERAVNAFRNHLDRLCEQSASGPVAPLVLTKFEAKDVGYGVWVTATLDRVGLPETSVLRFMDHQHWHVFVTVRGCVEVHDCPKEYRQFKGKRAFGFKFV